MELEYHELKVTSVCDYPVGRYLKDGPCSGEFFRQKHIVPALKNYELVRIHLDHDLLYGASWLEECFGGLVRKEGFTAKEVNDRLLIICNEVHKGEIFDYIDNAVAL